MLVRVFASLAHDTRLLLLPKHLVQLVRIRRGSRFIALSTARALSRLGSGIAGTCLRSCGFAGSNQPL